MIGISIIGLGLLSTFLVIQLSSSDKIDDQAAQIDVNEFLEMLRNNPHFIQARKNVEKSGNALAADLLRREMQVTYQAHLAAKQKQSSQLDHTD